jgi:pentatricopeptide repeat protein
MKEFTTNPSTKKATSIIADITNREGNFDDVMRLYEITLRDYIGNSTTNKQPFGLSKSTEEKTISSQATAKEMDDFYNTMISACWRFKQMSLALSLLDQMHQRQVQPNEIAFKLLSSLCHDLKDASAAEKVLNMLKESKKVIEIWDCANLIKAFLEGGQNEGALAVLDYMDMANIKPDSVIYTLLMKAATNMKSLEAGKKITDHIEKSGFKFTPFMHTSLISMYGKCGDLDTAVALFNGTLRFVL